MNVHYSHEEWRMIFSQRLQSGLSVRKWCEKNNFKYDTYKYWEKKIRRLDSEPESFPVAEQPFIELPLFPQELPNSFLYGMVVTNVDGTETYLYTNHYQMLIIQLLGMRSLFCILFAYKKLLHNFRLSTEVSLLEQEEHSLNQYVEEAKAHYDETKSFRHDIRNHIAVVKNLQQSGNVEKAVSYVEDKCIG